MLMRRWSMRGLVALALLALTMAPWAIPTAQGQISLQTVQLAPLGGTNPVNLAVNEVTNRLYIVNQATSNVTVLNAITGGFVANVPVGINPFDVAVNPNTGLVYVTNDGAAVAVSVSVIDSNNNVVATIPLTSAVAPTPGVTFQPFVAVNPATNTIYVTDNARNLLFVINGATNTVTQTIALNTPAGSQTRGIAVNPNTNKLYIAQSSATAGRIVVLNAAARPQPAPTSSPRPAPRTWPSIP